MSATVSPRAALAHPSFRIYLASSFLATVGAQMLSVAVGWQVYAVTHRPLDLGYVGLAQFVPAFALSPLAGDLADRLDRARIVATCELGLAVCSAALCLAGSTRMAVIYAVLVVVGGLRAFSAPAGQALVPGLVPQADFPNAVTWSSTMWQVATIVGPALGGALFGAWHAAGAVYVACAASLSAAGALLLAVPPQPSADREREGAWDTLLAGVRYVRRHRVILGSVSLDLFAVLLGGATALLPVFASDVLHVGPMGLGILRSAPAVGAAGMAAILAYHPLGRRTGALMLACVALFGVATIVFGLSRSFALSLASLAVIGASDMVSVVVRSTLVQLRTPPEMRGRVSAVNMMFIVASGELGELESGVTAALFGSVPAVVLGGIGTLVIVALYAVAFPELAAVDRLDEAV